MDKYLKGDVEVGQEEFNIRYKLKDKFILLDDFFNMLIEKLWSDQSKDKIRN